MIDFETFRSLVGTSVVADSVEHGPVELQIIETERAAGDRPDNAFSVLFKGPLDSFLEQQTCAFRVGDTSEPIFVVPVNQQADGYLYEAVFTALDSPQ